MDKNKNCTACNLKKNIKITTWKIELFAKFVKI